MTERKRPTDLYTVPDEHADITRIRTAAEVMAEQFPIRSGNDVLNKPRVTWAVPGWIPRRAIGVIYGPPGSGKSFYALSLALEVARGGRWAGADLDAAPVLYIAAERVAVLGERQRAWQHHHRHPIPDGFHEMAGAPQLKGHPDHLDYLIERVAELQPALVIIDTLAAATVGVNENDGTEFGLVVESLGKIRDAGAAVGTTVLAVHHSGKDATRGARGHTVLLGAVDTQIRITGDAAAVRAEVDKLNAARKPMPEWYKLEGVLLPALDDGTVSDSAVLVPTSAPKVGESHFTAILELLADAITEGIGTGKMATALGLSEETVRKAMNALVKNGLAEKRGSGPSTRNYITDAGLDALG